MNMRCLCFYSAFKNENYQLIMKEGENRYIFSLEILQRYALYVWNFFAKATGGQKLIVLYQRNKNILLLFKKIWGFLNYVCAYLLLRNIEGA